MRRIVGNGRNGAVPRALKARIILRKKLKREPESTEVIEYLTGHPNDDIPYTVVSAVFRAGEEVRPDIVLAIVLGNAVIFSENGL